MIFQIILSLLIILVIIRLLSQLFRKYINYAVFFFFLSIWVFVFYLNWNNEILNKIGNVFGVERGVNLVIYTALFFLFYYVFVSIIKFYRIERQINKLVKKDAVDDFLKRHEREIKK